MFISEHSQKMPKNPKMFCWRMGLVFAAECVGHVVGDGVVVCIVLSCFTIAEKTDGRN